MSNKIVNWLIGLFGVSSTGLLGKYLLVFFISLMPILELRGGLVAAALLKLPALPSYLISILGNIIPIPFILWFLDAVFDFMKKHNISGVMITDKDEIIVTKNLFEGFKLFEDYKIEHDLNSFKNNSDVILANRLNEELTDKIEKVYTRDIFFRD